MTYRSFLLLVTTLSILIINRHSYTPADIVISQIYGGGGNSGAPYKNDFIELFNRGQSPISINGWAIQYTSATGTSWSKTDLAGTIAPGRYHLIRLASGGSIGVDLPAPDSIGSIVMAAAAGKVVLTNSTTILTGSCPSGSTLVDLVGYGASASCFEGAGPAPAPSNTLSLQRAGNGCTETDQNSTNFATGPPTPRNSASQAISCLGGGARFSGDDVKQTTSDSGPCTTITFETRVTNSGTKAQRDNPGAEVVFDLAAGLTLVAGSCIASGSGQCAAPSSSKIEWNGGVQVGETVVITFQLRTDADVPVGRELCVRSTVSYDANDDGVNEAVTVVTKCVVASCEAKDPGVGFPLNSEHSGVRAGSVLVFPLYISNASAPQLENTRFTITNTSAGRAATVHLFFVGDDSPSVTDSLLCLTPAQTRSFLASEIDPGEAGYLIAIAVDPMTGCPVSLNSLTGVAEVRLASGHSASLLADAFAAIASPPAQCDTTSDTAEIRFDGKSYSMAPRVLAADGLLSSADGYTSLLILDRLGGSLLSGMSTLGQVNGIVFDDAEAGFSFSVSTTRRQLRTLLGNSALRTSPRLSEVISPGRVGWMKLWLQSDAAILGAIIVGHTAAFSGPAIHTGGRSLHRLKLTDTARLTIPVFPPSC